MNENQIMKKYLNSQIDCINKIESSKEKLSKIFTVLLKQENKKREFL